MFLIVGAGLRAGMIPVDQESGKVAIFERPIQNAPYLVMAIPNFPQSFFREFSASFDPYETAFWKEIYEVVPVVMGRRVPHCYAYATSREELDRFCARRNAEAEAKRNPPPRADKARAIDAYVVGEESGLVKVPRPRAYWDHGFPDRHPGPPGWLELRQVRVRPEGRQALREQGLRRLCLPGKEGR